MSFRVDDQAAFPTLAHRGAATPRDYDLTDRQLECLAWTQEGKSAVDIGQILGISARTVEGHLAKVCHHLGVRTRIQAVSKAKDLGFLGPTGP